MLHSFPTFTTKLLFCSQYYHHYILANAQGQFNFFAQLCPGWGYFEPPPPPYSPGLTATVKYTPSLASPSLWREVQPLFDRKPTSKSPPTLARKPAVSDVCLSFRHVFNIPNRFLPQMLDLQTQLEFAPHWGFSGQTTTSFHFRFGHLLPSILSHKCSIAKLR